MAVRSPYAPAGPLPPGAAHSEPVPMVVSAHSARSVCPDVTPVLSPAPPAAEAAARGAGTLPGDPSACLGASPREPDAASAETFVRDQPLRRN